MSSMDSNPKAAMERAMKVQDVMLQAMAKKITWWQAAEILGISDRHMRRWRERYVAEGYNGLLDPRRGKPSRRRVPMAVVEKVFALYREKYFDLSVQHFHEKLQAEHGIELSYTWVKQALQGVFCALYSDRGSHFWLTPKVGGKVDPHRLTQVGRALRELGVQMIPAYSPQARGRSERNFGTWQGRLPQELRLRGIRTVEAANRFLREQYIGEFNARFQVPAAQRGSAFVRRSSRDLDLIFALQFERTVNRDNTVSIQNLRLQIEPVRWRATLAGCMVTVHQHLDGTFTITHGPQRLGHYSAEGVSLQPAKIGAPRAVEKTRGGKVINPTFPSRLEIPQTPRDSHFPTASTAAGD